MEEDIKIIEEMIEVYRSCSVDEEGFDMRVDIAFMKKEAKALENLLTRYKDLDSLLGEIDNKEVSDALCMLLSCSLKDTRYETQKEQFKIANAYIKKLEKENEEWQRAYQEEKDKQFELLRENKNMAEEYLVNNPGMAKYLNENYIFKSKVKEKIEELEQEDLEIYDTDSEDVRIAKYEQRAILNVLQEFLRE